MDTKFLNDAAFKAAGWASAAAEIKRTYSPPIPTGGTSEYFQAPQRSTASNDPGNGEDEDEVGIVTGGVGFGSSDAVGASVAAGKRRRRKEQLEEDDSSDLSDESNEEAEGASQRPANSIRFAKMPVRARADSSPVRKRSESSPLRNNNSPQSQHNGPSLFVTSPSRPPESNRLRSGSLGAAEAVKARARRDTATSSEVSSEGDLDPSVFRRKRINSSATQRAGQTLTARINEDEPEPAKEGTDIDAAQDEPENEDDSDDDSLASGFSETVDANSLLDEVGAVDSSPLARMKTAPSPAGVSPKKSKPLPDLPQALPPPRPISTIQPVSALAAAIKAKNKKPTAPFERYSSLSGEKARDPLYIKIYVSSSSMDEDEPMKFVIRRTSHNGDQVTVADAIGYSLWRYSQDETEPKLTGKQLNINRWHLRIVEDGEVDFDFPPLSRTNAISDFTSNNNRPVRGRPRDKPWDEFGLVEASETQFKENEVQTPTLAGEAASTQEEVRMSAEEAFPSTPKIPSPSRPAPMPQQASVPPTAIRAAENPITASRLALGAFRKDSSSNLADMPALKASTATPRTGAPRKLTIHFTDSDGRPHIMAIDVTTDTYISEVFDQICARLNVDRGMFVLKVTGTTTVAPTDRIVESMGPRRRSLDLVRRRFVGEGGVGLSGSPGSTSPNAPLLLTASGTPKKHGQYPAKKGGSAHPLAQQSDLFGGSSVGAGLGLSSFKRYHVIRKNPMSFTPSNPRVLVLEGEYLHIMPGEAYGQPVSGKTHMAHFSSVIGCKVSRKHPKTIRVVVFREKESKKYDFECSSAKEAAEIVGEIVRGMNEFVR